LLQQHIDMLQQHRYNPGMRQLTFRELQTNTAWLKDLPLEVVKYGKVIMVLDNVTATSKQLEVNKEYIKELEAQIEKKDVNNEDKSESVTATPSTMGRCQAPSCPTVTLLNRGDYKEWFNGDLVVKSLLMCNKCIKKYKEMK